MGKSSEEIASISKDVINLLANKECTIEDADNILRITKLSIDGISTVRKLEY